MSTYDPHAIEPKWQKIWADTQLYAAVTGDKTRQKYYMLTEFPYPSGAGLHAGHTREYTLGDVMARHKRMQGYNVLYPMGYDAFGLPTENYAIKNKIAPQKATADNVATFRQQFDAMGFSFDWNREVNTTDPKFYKWTQWLFLQFYEKGLAYQAEMAINWCPKEKTGLANEEVVNGVHERCGTPVEKKLLKQWMLRITDYADRLIEGLKTVDYPPRIADQQVNWIGRSIGAEIDWKLDVDMPAGADKPAVTVYTTRPDTLFGATFLVISPELADAWKPRWDAPADVKAYIKKSLTASELDRQEDKVKTGVDTGIKAIHPLTGDLVPVWVADYVLGSYGTGAIMAVPAHDERDHAFAKQFGLPIKQVVKNPQDYVGVDAAKQKKGVQELFELAKKHNFELVLVGGAARTIQNRSDHWFHSDIDVFTDAQGYEFIRDHYKKQSYKVVEPDASFGWSNSYGLSGENWIDVFLMTKDHTGIHDEVSGVRFDWPQGLEEHEFHGAKVAIPSVQTLDAIYKNLSKNVTRIYEGYGPLSNSGEFNGLEGAEAKQAIVKALEAKGAGKTAKKYKLRDWIFSRQHYWGEPIPIIHCPTDGVVPVPEDQLPVTLPVVKNYEPTDTGESPLAAVTDWVNTTCPKCGGPAKRETDTMPNWAGSNWYYLRYMDPHNDRAFAGREALEYWKMADLYLGGMEHTTLHLLYSRFVHQFLYDQGLVPTPEPYAARRGQGIVLAADNRKMSKSIGNVINPTDIIATHGADTLRLYILFMAPYDETTPWSEERLNGASRFIYRVWFWYHEYMLNDSYTLPGSVGYENDLGAFITETDRITHKTIKKVHEDFQGMRFNTAVSALMEYVNYLTEANNRTRLLQENAQDLRSRTMHVLALLLAPIAPHLTEEIWRELGEEGSVHVAPWPRYDPELIKDDVITVVVQVNGKVRGQLLMTPAATDAELTAAAKADPKVAAHLEGKTIVKTIVVPRKIVNFVVKQ